MTKMSDIYHVRLLSMTKMSDSYHVCETAEHDCVKMSDGYHVCKIAEHDCVQMSDTCGLIQLCCDMMVGPSYCVSNICIVMFTPIVIRSVLQLLSFIVALSYYVTKIVFPFVLLLLVLCHYAES